MTGVRSRKVMSCSEGRERDLREPDGQEGMRRSVELVLRNAYTVYADGEYGQDDGDFYTRKTYTYLRVHAMECAGTLDSYEDGSTKTTITMTRVQECGFESTSLYGSLFLEILAPMSEGIFSVFLGNYTRVFIVLRRTRYIHTRMRLGV